VIVPPKKQKRRKDSPFLRGALFGSKWLWAFAGIVITLLGGFAILRPHVSIDPDLQLNPSDPFSIQFAVKNENGVFEVRELNPSCRTIYVITSHNVGLIGLPPRPLPTISKLEPNEKSTLICPPWIGGLGAGAGNVNTAFIEMDISYEQAWWPRTESQRFPFRGVIDSQGGVHWTHLTPSELQTDLSKQAPKL
jgi:hypothetical protein